MKHKIIILILLIFPLVGCQGLLAGLFVKDPEITRQEQETERLKHTQTKIVEANTPEKVVAIQDTHNKTSGGSHPSFWSNVVSALHTKEGQYIAGLIISTLGFAAAFGWKAFQSYFRGTDLIGTIVASQKIRKKLPDHSELIKETLAGEHEKRGSYNRMRKLVAKTLGETKGQINV